MIPIEICVAMANYDEDKQALVKYTELVNDHYEEPVGENFRTTQAAYSQELEWTMIQALVQMNLI